MAPEEEHAEEPEPREVEGPQFERAREDATQPWEELREENADDESDPPEPGDPA